MPACPICQSESKPAWQYQVYAIFECTHCALQFVFPMQGAPANYYQEHYTNVVKATQTDDIHPGFQYTVNKIHSVVRQCLKPNQRRAIDVGCGPGYLLSELSRMGFECLGIDFNPDVVRVAQEHFHVNAQVGRLEDLIAVHSQFDMALLVHVLEHAEDPLNLLRNIRQVLAPNGILLIDLPNRNRFAIMRSLSRGDFFWGEYPPHHLTFWSTASLTYALKSAGLAVLECHSRPFNQENQAGLFLSHRFHLPPSIATPVGRVFAAAGRVVGLQGETIYAIARRVD